jgi:50S ribosomal protein L16 3-hydroxylase
MSSSKFQFRLPAGIDADSFLRDYWQRRPLLMRAAMPVDCFTLGADELAGLACEPEFESRLIVEGGDRDWQIRHGPFDEADFSRLPESNWTLLVQDVDKFLPEVARLIDSFDFVPTWRVDDIMISYASDQGGVGPHTDDYDVFLMQAEGRRRWCISEKDYSDADLLPGLEQRILAHFETEQEWVLAPGDVLYLPPGVAHWGIAEGECMTYSLGFRAPNQQELAADWYQHLVSLCGVRRLRDPDDLPGHEPSQLTEGVGTLAADLLSTIPDTRSDDFRIWLGRYLTEPKPQFRIMPPASQWTNADLTDWIARGGDFGRHPFARLAWQRLSESELVLFYQGEDLRLPGILNDAVSLMAAGRQIDNHAINAMLKTTPEFSDLLLQLLNQGIIEPAETA